MLGKDEPHIPIVEEEARPLVGLDDRQYYQTKTLELHSSRVSMMCYVSIVFSLAITAIAAVVFAISKTVSEDKKVFIFTILGVATFAVWIILCVARRDTNALLIFTNVSMLVTGTVLGLTIGYT